MNFITIALALGLATTSTSVDAADATVVRMVTEVAIAHGVPPALAHSVVKVESEYHCRARSKDGATGIMQTMPRTARSVGVTGNLRDCRTGLVAGMRYLKQAIDKHGVTCKGISAYNSGIGGKGHCTAYGRKVLRLMRQHNEI